MGVTVKTEETAKPVEPVKNTETEVKTEETTVKENVYVDPFSEGVSYKAFLEAVGEKTVSEYCKGKLSKSEIAWLEKEIEIYKLQTQA